MKKGYIPILIFTVAFLLILGRQTLYVVNEWDQVILTQFGEAIGKTTKEPGLHFKIPFVQKVNRIEKRILEWDGLVTEMPTRDKLFIKVDTYARWQITDPLLYFTSLRDERSARSRLDDILGSETRNAVAKHDLIEIIRTSKGRKPENSGEITKVMNEQSGFDPIRRGRTAIENDIVTKAIPKLTKLGISLLDIRFKRINYNTEVERRIFERMISERKQIAERFRSEGAGEAARIIGDMEREVLQIESEAYKEVQTLLGESEAKSTNIYARAYGGTRESEELYSFLKTLETYSQTLDKNTTVILSTESDLFKLLKSEKEAE